MGLLNSNGQKETKEEKAARKEQELLEKYNLQDLKDPRDIESVKSIASDLANLGWFDAGMKLSMNYKPEDMMEVSYQRAMVEQNFIIIRQLDQISRRLYFVSKKLDNLTENNSQQE